MNAVPSCVASPARTLWPCAETTAGVPALVAMVGKLVPAPDQVPAAPLVESKAYRPPAPEANSLAPRARKETVPAADARQSRRVTPSETGAEARLPRASVTVAANSTLASKAGTRLVGSEERLPLTVKRTTGTPAAEEQVEDGFSTPVESTLVATVNPENPGSSAAVTFPWQSYAEKAYRVPESRRVKCAPSRDQPAGPPAAAG